MVEANASSNKTEPVTTQALRGLRPIELATFDQGPLITWSSPSKSGRLGQKIQRPKTNNNAGNKVKIVSIALTIPIAPMGPRPAVLVS